MTQMTLEEGPAPAPLAIHTTPTHPMPGDAVRLDGPLCGAEEGEIGFVDSSHYYTDERTLAVCFRTLPYRDSLRRMGVVARLEMGDTDIVGRDEVTCSGGPMPFRIRWDEFEFVGTHEATFWRFKNGIQMAHNGERYKLTVPLWKWIPPPGR